MFLDEETFNKWIKVCYLCSCSFDRKLSHRETVEFLQHFLWRSSLHLNVLAKCQVSATARRSSLCDLEDLACTFRTQTQKNLRTFQSSRQFYSTSSWLLSHTFRLNRLRDSNLVPSKKQQNILKMICWGNRPQNTCQSVNQFIVHTFRRLASFVLLETLKRKTVKIILAWTAEFNESPERTETSRSIIYYSKRNQRWNSHSTSCISYR